MLNLTISLKKLRDAMEKLTPHLKEQQ